MNQIVIEIRGAPRSGKTSALRALLGAIHDAGLLDESSVTASKPGTHPLGEVVESVAFNQPTASQINRAADQIAARGYIFTEVNAERRYQTDKWGIAADDTQNTPWMWVSYITQYATKWMTGLFHVPTSSADLFRTAMIKTATTAIAAVESLDRQRARHGRAFYETAE